MIQKIAFSSKQNKEASCQITKPSGCCLLFFLLQSLPLLCLRRRKPSAFSQGKSSSCPSFLPCPESESVFLRRKSSLRSKHISESNHNQHPKNVLLLYRLWCCCISHTPLCSTQPTILNHYHPVLPTINQDQHLMSMLWTMSHSY